ncbi:MAG: nucleotidyltransferase domain-containing protein [Nanoarchaeota archaeon]
MAATKSKTIKELKEKFKFLQSDVLAILVFGSYVKKDLTPRSDIDICLVAPDRSPAELLKKVFQNTDTKGFDIYCFQELPLHIQKEIIENHLLLYTKDKPALYEYFYFFRKLWNAQKHRQGLTKEEMLAMV